MIIALDIQTFDLGYRIRPDRRPGPLSKFVLDH